jgi:hypothetical protein
MPVEGEGKEPSSRQTQQVAKDLEIGQPINSASVQNLPMSGITTKAPTDEIGGNSYVQPTATEPHLDCTLKRPSVLLPASPFAEALKLLRHC